MMTSDSQDNAACYSLATYGTLRDDDLTSPPSTRDFIKNIHSATTGKVLRHRLYFNPTGKYALGIFTGDIQDSIVVRVLSWSCEEEFDRTLQLLDKFEGPDYQRKRVEVMIDGNPMFAYMYVAKPELLSEIWKLVPNGDWLQRDIQ